ncbi:hypothetical protein PG997_010241 [Apiospora hydei]|uniref:Uncharacterized protein n=1 Tax=Apiospora hydei TaxID=1337664 RepID=A0ABR1VWG8_9PEZI
MFTFGSGINEKGEAVDDFGEPVDTPTVGELCCWGTSPSEGLEALPENGGDGDMGKDGESSDKTGKRITRSAAASSSQTAPAPGNNEAAAPKPLTSGDLKYRPMRLWQRRQVAKKLAKEQLEDTVFVFLQDENIKSKILSAIDECVTDDINSFMDHSPPGALYPYAERVHSAIKTVFRDNLRLFKCLGFGGTNLGDEDLDYFGDDIDEPILEELFCEDKGFFLAMAKENSNEEDMKNGEASSNG